MAPMADPFPGHADPGVFSVYYTSDCERMKNQHQIAIYQSDEPLQGFCMQFEEKKMS